MSGKKSRVTLHFCPAKQSSPSQQNFHATINYSSNHPSIRDLNKMTNHRLTRIEQKAGKPFEADPMATQHEFCKIQRFGNTPPPPQKIRAYNCLAATPLVIIITFLSIIPSPFIPPRLLPLFISAVNNAVNTAVSVIRKLPIT